MLSAVTVYILLTLRLNMRLIDKENNENSEKDQFLNLYIRILTDYFQVISAIIKIKIKFVYGIGDFFTKFSFISDFIGNFFAFIYPLTCIYNIINVQDLNVFYINLYLLIAFSPFIMLINFLFWFGIGLLSKKSLKWIFQRIGTSLFLISYMVQPSLINAFFKYINCIEIEGELYLRNYLVEKCWVGRHLFYSLIFVLPSLFFWMIAYPLFILFILRKNRNITSSMRFSQIMKKGQNLSFFSDGLSDNCYYWEILLMFRKYLFIILSFFPLSNNNLQINLWILSIISFTYLIFQMKKKPYLFNQAVKFSLFSNGVILTATLSILILLIQNSVANQMVILAYFSILNVTLILKWIYDVYTVKKKDIVSKLSSLKRTLGNAMKKQRSLASSKKVFSKSKMTQD